MGLVWFVAALLLPYGALRLTASVLSPLATVIATVLALVPALPITGGLYAVAMRIAQEKHITLGSFWQSIARHHLLSLKLGGTILVIGVILVVDVLFYLNSGVPAFTIIGLLGLWGLLFWSVVQIHLFPMTFLLEEPRLSRVLKNAAALTLAYPFFALGILLVIFLATALSLLLLLILLATVWMPFIAILNCRATLSSLDEVKQYRAKAEEIRQEQDAREKGAQAGAEQESEDERSARA
jgi:hypothetical protein